MAKAKFVKVKYDFIKANLTASEWGLLSYLTSLIGGDKCTKASNIHLAESLGMSERTICRSLNSIEECGLITRDTKNNGHYGMSRSITITPYVKTAYFK